MPEAKAGILVNVTYDHGYGGYFVVAKLVELTKGMVIDAMNAPYASRCIIDDCKRGSASKLMTAAEMARLQLLRRDGLAWEVAKMVSEKSGVSIPGWQASAGVKREELLLTSKEERE